MILFGLQDQENEVGIFCCLFCCLSYCETDIGDSRQVQMCIDENKESGAERIKEDTWLNWVYKAMLVRVSVTLQETLHSQLTQRVKTKAYRRHNHWDTVRGNLWSRISVFSSKMSYFLGINCHHCGWLVSSAVVFFFVDIFFLNSSNLIMQQHRRQLFLLQDEIERDHQKLV